MTIYGESDDQFRPRPSGVALFATAFSQTIIGTVLTAVVLTSSMAALARFREWRTDWILFAPFAGEPLLDAFAPSREALSLAALIAAAAALLLAIGIAHFWPTDQKLSVRLFVYAFATALIAFGALPIAFTPSRFTPVAGVPPIVSGIAAGLVAAWLLMRVEKRAVEMMGAFFATTTPGQRLKLWLLRVPAPLAIAGAVAWLNGDRARAWAAGAAIAVTFFENLSRRPAAKFESVSAPFLREEAVALPVVAIVLLGGSIWLFGLDAANLPPRAIVASSKGISLRSIKDIARAAAAKKKQEEPKIQIWWSKDKKPGQ